MREDAGIVMNSCARRINIAGTAEPQEVGGNLNHIVIKCTVSMVRRSGKFFDARYVDIAGRQLDWEEIIRENGTDINNDAVFVDESSAQLREEPSYQCLQCGKRF